MNADTDCAERWARVRNSGIDTGQVDFEDFRTSLTQRTPKITVGERIDRGPFQRGNPVTDVLGLVVLPSTVELAVVN